MDFLNKASPVSFVDELGVRGGRVRGKGQLKKISKLMINIFLTLYFYKTNTESFQSKFL
jgi:hypothetical protein